MNQSMLPSESSASNSNISFAYQLDGNGGVSILDPETICNGISVNGLVWIHLSLNQADAAALLKGAIGLDDSTIDTLVASNPTPNLVIRDDSLLLVLKGIHQRPSADLDYMASLRLWTNGTHMISCESDYLRSIDETRLNLVGGKGPQSIGHCIAEIADRLMDHADEVLEEFQQETVRISSRGAIQRQNEDLISELATLRKRMILMHYDLVPQARALNRLSKVQFKWIEDSQKSLLESMSERSLHAAEGLVAAGLVNEITKDEILQRSSEITGRRIFSLTVITVIFMPLSFVTGLLGVNLAGIPDANDPYSFVILCLLLLSFAVIQILLLRHKGWL